MMPNPVTLGLSPKRFPPCWLRWRLHWTLPTASSPGVWGQPKLGKWTRYESASCKANMWPYVWVHRQRAEFCWVWPIEGGKLHGFSWFGLMILLPVTWKKSEPRPTSCCPIWPSGALVEWQSLGLHQDWDTILSTYSWQRARLPKIWGLGCCTFRHVRPNFGPLRWMVFQSKEPDPALYAKPLGSQIGQSK